MERLPPCEKTSTAVRSGWWKMIVGGWEFRDSLDGHLPSNPLACKSFRRPALGLRPTTMKASLDSWLSRLAVMAWNALEFLLQFEKKKTWLLNHRTKGLARRPFRWAERTRKQLRRTSVLRVLLVPWEAQGDSERGPPFTRESALRGRGAAKDFSLLASPPMALGIRRSKARCLLWRHREATGSPCDVSSHAELDLMSITSWQGLP